VAATRPPAPQAETAPPEAREPKITIPSPGPESFEPVLRKIAALLAEHESSLLGRVGDMLASRAPAPAHDPRLDAVLTRLESLESRVDERLGTMDARVDSRFAAIIGKMDLRLGGIEERADKGFEQLSGQLSGQPSAVVALQLGALEDRISNGFEATTDLLGTLVARPPFEVLDQVNARLDTLAGEISALGARVGQLAEPPPAAEGATRPASSAEDTAEATQAEAALLPVARSIEAQREAIAELLGASDALEAR
jgi:hypothetical protein